MRKNRFPLIFLLLSLVLLVINIAIVIVFSIVEMEGKFYNALNVASLSVSFLSFVVSSFFSFSIYLQTEKQNKINDSLPKKDDQYIIANYSLFNIENEVSFFSLSEEEKKLVLEKARYLVGDAEGFSQNITRLVFLPTNSTNKPTYKVLIKGISFFSAQNKKIYTASVTEGVDGEYSANILQRGYNCICVDIANDCETMQYYFSNSKYIELRVDIISVFNVNMSVTFFVHLDSEKNVSANPDKEKIKDLRTYTIHHANYTIENKSIVS